MRKKMLVLFAVLVMLAVVVIPAAAITWGDPDTEHDNVGAMVYRLPDDNLWQTCSGTLIHERVFLTAGHCTEGWDDEDSEPVWVNFDTNALNEDTLLDVEKVITHPDFDWGDSNPHDVGLLILEEPVEGIEPANIPYVDYLDDLKKSEPLRSGEGEIFTMVGYGGTLGEEDWPPPDISYHDQRQVAVSEYVALTQVWLHLSQHLSENDRWDILGGTCFGDSGGPAFWTEEDGDEMLVALTSTGDAQCVATGLYYRVDLPDTLNFIAKEISKLE